MKTVYFDTNIYNLILDEGLSDDEYGKLQYAKQKGLVETLFSDDVLYELAVTFRSDQGRCRQLLKIGLEVMSGRIIKESRMIIGDEILGFVGGNKENTNIFQEENIQKDEIEHIEGVVNGGLIIEEGYLHRCDQQLKKDNEFMTTHIALWKKRYQDTDEPCPKNFGEFHGKPGDSELYIIKKTLGAMRVCSGDDCRKIARDVCENIDLLPHLKARLATISAILFSCLFEGVERTGNHRGDIHHLVCATNVDIFVSNDSDFSRTFPKVHSDKVLMDFKEFSDYLNTVV